LNLKTNGKTGKILYLEELHIFFSQLKKVYLKELHKKMKL